MPNLLDTPNEQKPFQESDLGDHLTEWENEPTLLSLKSDFESAKIFHDNQMSKINEWNDLLLVRGKERPPKLKNRSGVQPKLIRRQAEWRYSALSEPFLGSTKLFSVSPRTFEDFEAAKQNELLLNYQFDTKLNKVKFIDDYVRATVDEGTGIVRVGWERQTEEVSQEVPIWGYYSITDPTEIETLNQAIQLKESDPRAFEELDEALQEAVNYTLESGIPVMARIEGTTTEIIEKVIENHPVVEVMNPDNIYVDPSCNGDINKALFIVVSFETNKADCIKAGIYKNLDKVNWEESVVGNDPDHATETPDSFRITDSLRKRVIAYEYWGYYDIHKTGELVPIVATWIGNTMIRMEENPFPDGKLPFIFTTYLPVKRSLYGEPDAELLKDNQRILGAVTRGMIDLLGKSANSQQGFAKGALDPLNRKRFENGQDYEFNQNYTPNASYIMHTYPEIPQSALLMVQMQNQEAEALTGVKSFSGGLAGDAYNSRVATAIRGVLDAASKREMAILRRLAKGIREIGDKIIAMNAVFLSEEEVVRITNKKFITIKREDIKGNFDLQVDISTAEVDNAKAQDMGFMVQTIGPNMDQRISLKLLAEIAELKRMPKLAEELRTYKPEPNPLQEEAQRLEIEKLRLEVEKLKSEVAYNQARVQKTMADAEATAVDTQLDVSGTKHQRDMEKQQAQARGNQNLEVTKALLKSRKADESSPNVDAAIGYNVISGL